ncbi:NAD(P)-binding protein [Gymnopus androsaceus JB14]|uniref:NAD(P)-binding protein n=1 Tax=Gymnopus androsaceus JB14 TaxID=1447944 RepID=A0A6A4I429_9AGAR|nr:NAD(P)-binding protein [Gymnopus androsaceus JB14]
MVRAQKCEDSLLHNFIDQSWPPKPSYSVEDIPDLTGRVVIVTGGNSGIGKETVKALLTHNARVYIAARSKEKAEQAIQELSASTGKEALFLKLDLADLTSVKAAAEEFTSLESELHILFNNAGVMVPPIGELTLQGYDLQFGTHVLGHFYFTQLLLPLLLSTARSSLAAGLPKGTVRIVNTSSDAHLSAKGVDYKSLREGKERKSMGSLALYEQSKLGNVLLAIELASRYGEEGIITTSLNPGHLKSDLQRHMPKVAMAIVGPLILHPTPLGALTQLWAGTSPEGAEFNGKYLIPWARMGKASKHVTPAMANELWKWLEDQVAGQTLT